MPIANFLGVFAFLAFAYLISENRKHIDYKSCGRILALQFFIAVIILVPPQSAKVMEKFSAGVSKIIAYSNEGIAFVFGPLADFGALQGALGNGAILAVQVFPIIIFISALFAALAHLRVMDWVIRVLGGALRWITGTSRLESTVAAASIFIGMVEAPLAILPYLKRISRAQLFAAMSCGLASIAGTVLVVYAQLGVRLDLLLTASFMAAAGGLLMAKIIVPETGDPLAIGSFKDASDHEEGRASNLIEAVTNGALTGLHIMLAVLAVIIAFVAIIALLNGIIGGIGGIFGFDLSLEKIFGFVFAPIAWLIGVPWSEAAAAGTLLAEKLVANEFLAYLHFTQSPGEFSAGAQIAITVALCGFANFVGVGILLAGLGNVVPERKAEIAGLGMRALAAGTLSNFMSAALVGIAIWIGGGA